jgi:glycosyltransferase involved in cell wall biosynthesis
MKILQLNFEKTWRGGERQTLYCMQAFRQAGHQVELLCRAGSPLHDRAVKAGFVVHAPHNVMGQLCFLATTGRRYDVLHAQTANTVTSLVLTKILHRRPIVFTRRTAFAIKPKSEWKTHFKWRRVDALVAISEVAAAEPRRLGLHTEIIRSAVEPHSVDADKVAALMQEFQLHGCHVIATSAALSREKDPLTLVRAVAALARVRQDFIFIHFGASGDVQAQAQAEVQRLGIQDKYLFAGFRPGVEDFYSVMDVFVMSSIQEALGSSVLDAFLKRVPVVSTDAGGLKEILTDGRGILCAVGDADALAQGMARCLDDAALRAAMTQRAYDYVRTEHDVQEMEQRYLTLYKKCLKPRV